MQTPSRPLGDGRVELIYDATGPLYQSCVKAVKDSRAQGIEPTRLIVNNRTFSCMLRQANVDFTPFRMIYITVCDIPVLISDEVGDNDVVFQYR